MSDLRDNCFRNRREILKLRVFRNGIVVVVAATGNSVSVHGSNEDSSGGGKKNK